MEKKNIDKRLPLFAKFNGFGSYSPLDNYKAILANRMQYYDLYNSDFTGDTVGKAIEEADRIYNAIKQELEEDETKDAIRTILNKIADLNYKYKKFHQRLLISAIIVGCLTALSVLTLCCIIL